MKFLRLLVIAALIISTKAAVAQDKLPTRMSNGSELQFMKKELWQDLPKVDKQVSDLLVINVSAGTTVPQLQSEGWQVLHAFSKQQYLVKYSEGVSSQSLVSLAPFLAIHKVSAALNKAWNGNTKRELHMALGFDLKHSNQSIVLQQAKLAGLKIMSTHLCKQGIIEVLGTRRQLDALLTQPYIFYAGIAAQDEPLNREVISNNGAFLLQNSLLYGSTLQGDSVVIGVGDTYTTLDHTDLKDRTINFNPLPPHMHGILTAGVASGAGNINPRARGVAPHASLISHWFNRVWAESEDMRANYGMTLTNNSYAATTGSCATAGSYDVYSQQLDQMALDYPDLLHVFAAGNDGAMVCSPYPAGFANIPGGYQVAKNVLTVGMTYKWLMLHNGSSRGPVMDGRLKPEIVTIGGQVFGPSVNDGYIQTSGTSLSCPNAVGGLALLTQRYRHLHSGQNPRTDILKAILLGSTTDLGRRGPDYQYGYGMMNLRRAMNVLEQNQYLRDSVAHSATKNINITVPAGLAQLKVLMYYHDVPASALATTQLVNNLNLTVTDPALNVSLPLVLNPNPANVTDTAVQGVDQRNNSEMVVINNPTAGNYTLTVSGASVSTPYQSYALAYDFVEQDLHFLYPTFNASHPNTDSLRIYWEAPPNNNGFTIEFSENNGSTWTVLSNSIVASARSYSWMPTAGMNKEQCLLRLSRNSTSQSITSPQFVINTQPVVSLAATQCPGFMAITWTGVADATGYEVWVKRGQELSYVGSVAAPTTSYTIGGLSQDSVYWAAVYPMFNTMRGYRSIAISRTPNTGTCVGSFAAGDLAIRSWVGPQSGRLGTTTALTSNESITLQIANNDDVAVSNYQIHYSINGGAWQSVTPATTLAAATSNTVSLSGFNFAAAGEYALRIAVQNLSAVDPYTHNDTLKYTVRQLSNPLINLMVEAYNVGFEANTKMEIAKDTIGWDASTRWDFYNATQYGRLRTFVANSNLIAGARSVSLDSWLNNAGTTNFLIGTFNLSNLDTALHEARLSFQYRLHGKPKSADSNTVWVRGNDVSPWLPLFRFDTTKTQGTIEMSGSLSLSAALSAGGQAFSTATQLRFGQNDTSVISGTELGNGITLDNVSLFLVQNDLALLKIKAPAASNCGTNNAAPLTVSIYNSVNQNISGATVTYRLNNGTPITETLPIILAKDTIDYTFTSLLNLASIGTHELDVWINAPLDNYAVNDSIHNYIIRNQPVISSYPYLQNFENGDGAFYAEGQNSSWAYGTPASFKISKAASGTKAWKTSLAGHYNDLETSYLYSPCFDLTGLTAPMLSFSHAVDIEDCGSLLCDQGYIEYTTNGTTWVRLGALGQGTNWYNNGTFQAWIDQSNTRWRVASIPLPVTNGILRFRFVLNSDPGGSFDGMAIDDIHVFNLDKQIYDGASVSAFSTTVNGVGYTNAEQAGKLLAQYKTAGSASYNLSLAQYVHTSLFNPSNTQYFFPRSYVLQSAAPLTDSIDVRLFLLDADFLTMKAATGCTSCSKASDVYEMGITKYTGTAATENGSLADNNAGTTTYIPFHKISWVPYDKGYYAQVRLGNLSELWFNDGGPNNTLPLPLNYISYKAFAISDIEVKSIWTSQIDTDVKQYMVQRSVDGTDFSDIDTIPAKKIAAASYESIDPSAPSTPEVLYYRLKWMMDNGRIYFSQTIPILRGKKGEDVLMVYPNPSTTGNFTLSWKAAAGTTLRYRIIDVTGKLVMEKELNATQWYNEEKIGTEQLAKGVYTLQAQLEGKAHKIKLVVR